MPDTFYDQMSKSTKYRHNNVQLQKKCYTNVTPKKMFSEILGNVRKRSRMLVETLPMNHLLAQLQIVAEIHSIEDDRQLSTEIPL